MPQMTIQQALELAMKHQQSGQADEVQAICRQILLVQPNHPDALHLLGVAAIQTGQFTVAVERISAAIAAYPSAAHYHCNLGVALLWLDRVDEAIAAFGKSLALDPNSVDALNGLGNALQGKSRFDEAIAAYQRALDLRPAFPPVWHNLANALEATGRTEQAIEALQRAVSLQPDYVDARHMLGRLLHSLRRYEEALPHARRAIELRPDFVQAWNNLGTCLHATGDVAGAIQAFRRALSLSPDLPEAHHNLAHSLQSLGQEEEAMAHARAALAARPDFADARNNLGTCLLASGEVDAAIEAYRQALSNAPDDPLIHFNIGLTLLLKGDFERGLPEHEWRLRSDELGLLRRDYTQPCWDGSDLNGRRILLYPEQGFGDAIQFARFVPMVRHLGAKVLLAVPTALHRLMKSLDGVDQLLTDGQNLPEFDVHCSLLSLPLLLNTRIGTIPAHVPYLQVDADSVAQWRQRLEMNARKIGLVWAGRPTYAGDHHRSMSPEWFAPLAEMDGVQLFSLQKDASSNATGAFGGKLNDWTTELHDFADTAAMIENLDLVISVDTAVAHLAGALGKPVWLLLPFMPDWRWMLDRADSPWYPTARLFRQTQRGDWTSPIARVIEEFQ